MKKLTKKYRSHCPINFAQEAFGDRWSLLIIRDLMFKGKRYYGEFLESGEKISTNILADRLLKLETDGFITKTVDHEKRTKNVYSLTDKAIDLMPMLVEMIAWSAKYDPNTETPDEFLAELKKDKSLLLKNLRFSILSQSD
jgi:DNA-binding HxlR family transcriptional regulator